MNVGGGKPLTARHAWMLSRAIHKIALGFAWLDHGAGVYEEKFDTLRNSVLGEPRDGCLLLAKKGATQAMQGLSLTYGFSETEGAPGVWVFASILGTELFSDTLRPSPAERQQSDVAIAIEFRKGDCR